MVVLRRERIEERRQYSEKRGKEQAKVVERKVEKALWRKDGPGAPYEKKSFIGPQNE